MPKKLTKIISSFLICFALAFSFIASPTTASAAYDNPTANFCELLKKIAIVPGFPAGIKDLILDDREWYRQTLCQFNYKVTNSSESEIFGERYTSAQVNWILNSITLTGIDALSNIASTLVKLESNPTIAKQNLNNQLSFVKWAKSGLDKFQIASPVSAQGYGFNTLTGLQSYWAASRNLAYLVMIVLLVAAGFMIMFRVKINPQTAVSLQLMIPKIIITLVLVTFSYAIAGLVIDLIYLIIGFVVYALQVQGLVTNSSVVLDKITRSDMLFIWDYFSRALPFMTIVGGLLIPILGALLVPIIVLVLILRVTWLLIRTYLTLIFQVIIAPWYIMIGILPNQSGFGSWFRSFLASASVFVVVPLLFLTVLILWSFGTTDPVLYELISALSAVNGTGFVGFPLEGGLPNLPLIGGSSDILGALFGMLIMRMLMGLGILALMPRAAQMIQEAIKVPPFKHGTAFNEALTIPLVGAGRGLQFASEGAPFMNNVLNQINQMRRTSRGAEEPRSTTATSATAGRTTNAGRDPRVPGSVE